MLQQYTWCLEYISVIRLKQEQLHHEPEWSRTRDRISWMRRSRAAPTDKPCASAIIVGGFPVGTLTGAPTKKSLLSRQCIYLQRQAA